MQLWTWGSLFTPSLYLWIVLPALCCYTSIDSCYCKKKKSLIFWVIWLGKILRFFFRTFLIFLTGGEDFENVIPKGSKAESMNVRGIIFKFYAFWYLMWLFMAWRRHYSLKVPDPVPILMKRRLFCCIRKKDRLALRQPTLHFSCKMGVCRCCGKTQSCTSVEGFSSQLHWLLCTNCAGFGKQCLHIGEP